MATTYYPKYYYKDAVGMSASAVKPVYQERLIDFATQNIATGNSAAMLAVPDNTLVMHCNYQTITTVADATSTFVIASNTKGISWVASAVAVASGAFGVPNATIANVGTWHDAKDDIMIKTVAVANLTAGQLRVFAVMLYPQPYLYVDADGNTQTYTFTDRNSWQTTVPTIP